MDKVTVDIDQAGAIVALIDDMGIPNFFIEGSGLGRHSWALTAFPHQLKSPNPIQRRSEKMS
jgi:hypothetical protein